MDFIPGFGHIPPKPLFPAIAPAVRYPALRSAAGFIKILTVVGSLVFGVATIVVFTSSPLVGIATAVAGIVWAVFSWAGSELLIVMIDIEANTRAAATRLEH